MESYIKLKLHQLRSTFINVYTLPETNIAHENPIFPGKYHQNCGFSMAMLVSGSVSHCLVEQVIS